MEESGRLWGGGVGEGEKEGEDEEEDRNLDSSLCFIQPGILRYVLCI